MISKLLLFAGAIQIAGSVKARKASRHASSDWMEIEKQRGISVASSVMQMEYRDCVINLLDPQVIVLGGGLSNITALYKEIPARWGAYVFSDRVNTLLKPALHGDASGVRGAAWLWNNDSDAQTLCSH